MNPADEAHEYLSMLVADLTEELGHCVVKHQTGWPGYDKAAKAIDQCIALLRSAGARPTDARVVQNYVIDVKP